MDQCHHYQREICERIQAEIAFSSPHPPGNCKILNIACKEDPANLGKDFNAVNLDLYDFDPHTQKSMYDLPNFVQGNALNLPFESGEFDLSILGEFIEHCTPGIARKALLEAARVTKPDGQILLTFPLDPRRPEGQHPPHLLITWYKEGEETITSYHQTVWDEIKLTSLLTGFTVVDRRSTFYGDPKAKSGISCPGIGLLLSRN